MKKTIKPIIGVIGKPQCDDFIWNKIFISNEIKDAICNNGGLTIGIVPQSKIKNVEKDEYLAYQYYYLDDQSLQDLYCTIDLCDGIILQGGITICDYEQKIVNYCIENDIPLLGICCGCINMALATGGSISIKKYDYLKEKHFSLQNMDMHNVIVDSGSKLFSLINKKEFVVNSIHKCEISNPGKYCVNGFSDDGTIELLEFNSNGFNIGVQWHPELIMDKDEQNMIFSRFVDYLKSRIG